MHFFPRSPILLSRPRAALSFLLSAYALSAPATHAFDNADIVYWNAGGGTWDVTNPEWTTDATLAAGFAAWDNTLNLSAQFTGTASTVTLADAITAAQLTFGSDGFTLAGNTLTLSSAGIIDTGSGTQTISSVLAGAATSLTKSGSGSLILTGANTYTGSTTVAAGSLFVSGSGASIGVASASASNLSVGSTANGSLTIQNGAVVKATSATLGASGTTGSVTVDGVGSRWDLTNTSGTPLAIASGGNGSLTVSNGGAVTAVRPASFTTTAGHTGTLLVDGTGSTFTSTNLNVQGAGTGSLTVSNGGVINSASSSLGNSSGTGGTVTALVTGTGSQWNLTAGSTPTLSMYGGTSLTIADGGSVTVGWSVYLGDTVGSLAKVTVGGNSATLNVTNAAFAVGDFGSGTLEVNAGGIVNAGFNLRLGNADAAVGIVNQNGGTVTVARYIEFFKGTAEYHLLGGTLVVGDEFGAGIVTPSATSYLFELGGGTLQVKGGANSTLTNYANVTLKDGTTSTLSAPGANQVMYMEGVISGSGALLKTGPGALYLDQVNTFTGGLTLAQGIVNPVDGGLGAGPLVFSGNSTLQVDYQNTTFAGDVTLDADVTGTIEVTGATRTLTLSGDITGDGALRKTSTGILVLTGANDYAGATTISGGLVRFSNAGNFGAGAITLNGGGLQWATGNTLDITADSRLAAIGSSGATFNTNGNDVTFAHALSGTGGLVKTGAGTLTLSVANSYTGTTTATAGTLALGHDNALGSGALILNGGTLSSLNAARSLGNSVTLSANSTIGGAQNLTFTGNLTNSGGNRTLTVSNSGVTTLGGVFLSEGTSGRTLTLAGTGALTIDGTIANRSGAGANASSLTLTHTGTVTLNGANTYTGTTTLSAGTLVAGSNTALGAGTLALNGGTLRGNGSARTLANALTHSASSTIGGTSALTFTGNFSNSGASRVLTVSNAGTTTFAGSTFTLAENNQARVFTLNNSGVVLISSVIANGTGTGADGFTKTGAGTLTLTAANTYTGATSVNAGTLFVNGSLANTAVTVASGATLGGSGSIGGFTTLQSGAHLAPGSLSAGAGSAGTLTFTNGLGLVAGAILDFQLGVTSDSIRVSGGSLTGPASGLITLNLADAGDFNVLEGGTYTLFNFSGASLTTFDASSFTFGSILAGTDASQYALNLDLTAQTLSLTYSLAGGASPIPEPSTYAALAGALALGLAAWRKRRSVR